MKRANTRPDGGDRPLTCAPSFRLRLAAHAGSSPGGRTRAGRGDVVAHQVVQERTGTVGGVAIDNGAPVQPRSLAAAAHRDDLSGPLAGPFAPPRRCGVAAQVLARSVTMAVSLESSSCASLGHELTVMGSCVLASPGSAAPGSAIRSLPSGRRRLRPRRFQQTRRYR